MRDTLQKLFAALRESGYDWFPRTPEVLQKLRKQSAQFPLLVKFFGLGLPLTQNEFEEVLSDIMTMGFDPSLLSVLATMGLNNESARKIDTALIARQVDTRRIWTRSELAEAQMSSEDTLIPPPFAVSVINALSAAPDIHRFVLHSHWPPVHEHAASYVHCGAETLQLIQILRNELSEILNNTRVVLDIGCSSGPLSFAFSDGNRRVHGVDICHRAIDWAKAAAEAQGLTKTSFDCVDAAHAKLPQDEDFAKGVDLVVFNPPMIIPEPGVAYPHRDGGPMGVELPLMFLDLAKRAKARGVVCLSTNPIVNGRNVLFEKLTAAKWKVRWESRLNPYFNQSVAKERAYDRLGVERIELWALYLVPA